jgi:hypothetical protein
VTAARVRAAEAFLLLSIALAAAANATGNRADRRATRLGLDECVEGAQDD